MMDKIWPVDSIDVEEMEEYRPHSHDEALAHVRGRELAMIDFSGTELEGSNENYAIVVSMLQEPNDGEILPVYGVYNRYTGIRESEMRQIQAAKQWVKTLTEMNTPNPVDALGEIDLPDPGMKVH